MRWSTQFLDAHRVPIKTHMKEKMLCTLAETLHEGEEFQIVIANTYWILPTVKNGSIPTPD